MPNGERWGILNRTAQSIKIKCDERYDDCGNYVPYGGSLEHIKGDNFTAHFNKNCKTLIYDDYIEL